MKRGQVFVRAQDPDGRWHTADVLDLDQPSFNAWVTDVLFRAGLIVGLRDESLPTSVRVEYHSLRRRPPEEAR
jgi:hypothetical protein